MQAPTAGRGGKATGEDVAKSNWRDDPAAGIPEELTEPTLGSASPPTFGAPRSDAAANREGWWDGVSQVSGVERDGRTPGEGVGRLG